MIRIVFLMMCLAAAANAQQRPLITEDVDIIPPGSIRIEAGIDFMQGAKYTVSGLNGDLTRVGVIGINFGMGPNVEFQIEGVAQNYLSINSRGFSAIPLELAPGANSANDTGDFTLAAKFKLRKEGMIGAAKNRIVGVVVHCHFRGVGLSENDRAGCFKTRHRGRICLRNVINTYLRTARRSQTGCLDRVFNRNRHAV